jgi:hypothetical protein
VRGNGKSSSRSLESDATGAGRCALRRRRGRPARRPAIYGSTSHRIAARALRVRL